ISSGSSFFDKVESYAVDRQYLGLSTRGDLVDQMRADDVVLYWLDALGVEYLGFIKRRAQEKGMALEIKIGRASIPTITSMNCDFYNSWEMGKKQKDSALDDLLHKNDKDVKASPEYLFLALEIIDAALQKIQKMLAKGECSAVLLASDHGSSRLAALYDAKNFISQLESGGTIDDGEHCGRCCPAKTGDNVPSYAVAEGEYWAIANYECFKGSSRRGYEYHGGATLEEILVPVVRFTLANEEEKPDINPIATKICVNRREAPRVAFTSSRASNSYRVCLLEKFYSVNPLEERSYEAVLEDFFERKLKLQEYDVDIYDGENKLATLRYSFEGETMNVNKKQSEFFD
ncbi:MAG: BREX-4 system phosphatase PglZ, partial [Thermoguttaceae bacterium]